MRVVVTFIVILERIGLAKVDNLDFHLWADDNVAEAQVAPCYFLAVQVLTSEKYLCAEAFRNSKR